MLVCRTTMLICRTTTLSLLALLVVSLLSLRLASASGTSAEKGTVLILPIGDESDVTLLQNNAAPPLRAAGLGVVTLEDAELAGFETKATVDCLESDGECEHLVRKAPAEWVLLLQIRRDIPPGTDPKTVPDADQRIIAKLFGANDGSLLQIEQRMCMRCSSSERMAKLTVEVVDIVANAELADQATETYIHVNTTPANATLTIDDILVGPTGQPYRVPPGEHEIVIALEGYQTVTQKVLVEANERKTLSVGLGKEGRAGGKSGVGRRILTWSTIAAGTVGLGLGATWIAIDGNKANDGQNGVRDTKTLGISSMVAGTILLGAGIALLLTDSDGSEGIQVSASPGPEGMTIGLSGHF